MDLESVFVTGANRGIGLELVKQLVFADRPPKVIFATHRTSESYKELEKLAKAAPDGVKLVLVQIDVTNPGDLSRARSRVEEVLGEESGLQLLVNNAGILQIQRRFPSTTADNMREHFDTNTLAPLMLFKEMYPLLQRAASRRGGDLGVARAAVINISSMAGSVGEAWLRPRSWLASVGYRTSKAALNMSMRLIAATVRDSGILVVNICPGWVRTALGGEEIADIEPQESVRDILNTLPTLGERHVGAFIDRHGKDIPF